MLKKGRGFFDSLCKCHNIIVVGRNVFQKVYNISRLKDRYRLNCITRKRFRNMIILLPLNRGKSLRQPLRAWALD